MTTAKFAMKRFSEETWDRPALQAAAMNVGICTHGGTIGVDMLAQDGSVFAHGHYDIATAERFRDALVEAIADAKAAAKAKAN